MKGVLGNLRLTLGGKGIAVIVSVGVISVIEWEEMGILKVRPSKTEPNSTRSDKTAPM